MGIDHLSPYYDPALKRARLERLEACCARSGAPFRLLQADLEDRAAIEAAFAEHRPERVVNLTARAGVRHSIENPAAYVRANLVGFGSTDCRPRGCGSSACTAPGAGRTWPCSC